MPAKILPKEVAEERMQKLGRDFSIIEWKGVTKACVVKCNKCNNETFFKRGDLLFAENSKWYRFRPCRACKIVSLVKKFREENNEEQLIKWEKIAEEKNIFIY